MKHAKLSASGSHRWINCPGSVEAEQGIKDKSSPHAQWGTECHELAEICLKKGLNASTFKGAMIERLPADDEMIETAQTYIDYVRAQKGELLVEQKVSFASWVPGGFGTCDAMVIKDETLTVIDLKGGQGVKVYAKDNTQAILYALGAWFEYGFIYEITRIKIVIVQPRLDHIDEWELPISELLEWGEKIKEHAALAITPGAPRKPGNKQCTFCKAKATCPALKEFTEKTLLSDFDTIDESELSAPGKLTDEQLKTVLDNADLISKWFDAVKTHVSDRLHAGEQFKGYKLVAGRSQRKWANPDDAAQWLEAKFDQDEIYTKKLIGIPGAEKLLGKADKGMIANLIVKPEGKPTMVHESDKRQPINNLADFDNIS